VVHILSCHLPALSKANVKPKIVGDSISQKLFRVFIVAILGALED
jgi:hypothetical protein